MKVETGCWRVNRLLFIWKFTGSLICSRACFTATKPFPINHQKIIELYIYIYFDCKVNFSKTTLVPSVCLTSGLSVHFSSGIRATQNSLKRPALIYGGYLFVYSFLLVLHCIVSSDSSGPLSEDNCLFLWSHT